MQHFDEHILDLYALGSSLVEDSSEEIEAHIRVCRRCGEVVDSFRAIYRTATGDFEETTTDAVSDLPVRASRTLQIALQNAPIARIPTYRLTSISRTRQFIQRHPIISGGGTFAALAVVTVLIVTFLRTTREGQPAYHHLNESAGTLEIYNKRNELLWSLPGQNIHSARNGEEETGDTRTVVADLNDDGTNEVVSVLFGLGANRDGDDMVRLFSPDGKEISQTQLSHEVEFHGVKYPSYLSLTRVKVDRFGPQRENLIVTEGPTGRSPYVVAALDKGGRILGEYWHFGNFSSTRLITDPATGQLALALGGTNDVADSVGEAYPVLVVIFPDRIASRTESRITPGFGYVPSEAEVYYVRLPRTLWETTNNLKPSVMSLEIRKNERGECIQLKTGHRYDPQKDVFEYTFDSNLSLLSVKTDDATRARYASLAVAKVGKNSGVDSYMQNLARQVRYWNGSCWVDQPYRLIK